MYRKKWFYVVWHGYVFGDLVKIFRSQKAAIDFIESQEYPEDFYFEKRR